MAAQFGFATSTDLDALITDVSVDLVDTCLPTRLHADIPVRAMQAGRDVLIEVPLGTTGTGKPDFKAAASPRAEASRRNSSAM